MKETLAGSGEGGSCYRDWRPFSARYLRQHFGLYIFNGLSQLPRVENKLRPQSEYQLHGIDFIYHSFGANSERRHRHFKRFLAVQDPSIETPSRNKYHNWKKRPLLNYITFLLPLIWILGIDFEIDEVKIGFQGMHADKICITYKNKGDGFQCDALCQYGFYYQFYFRNDSSPEEHVKSGLYPMDSRVISIDTVKDEHHICLMDHLYNSTTFCKMALNHPDKVLVHGVTQKGMCGIPACVIQEESKSKKKQLELIVTVKASVIQGDPDFPESIAKYFYDTKHVHYLSMVCR